jgi:hypothetical protein
MKSFFNKYFVLSIYVLLSTLAEALTDSNFQTACDAWVSDPSAATATYGDIKFWNTSAVTRMPQAFLNRASFNDDISRWDTSNVVSLFQVCNERMTCFCALR